MKSTAEAHNIFQFSVIGRLFGFGFTEVSDEASWNRGKNLVFWRSAPTSDILINYGKRGKADSILIRNNAGKVARLELRWQNTSGSAQDKYFKWVFDAEYACEEEVVLIVLGGGGWSEPLLKYVDAHKSVPVPIKRTIETILDTDLKDWLKKFI